MGGFSSAAPRRTHWERAQLKSRRHLGLLEKHKDYVERAKNYHLKERRIKALQRKARLRNEDEFYHGMIKSKTLGGIHQVNSERDKHYSGDLVRLMRTQDKGYIRYQRSVNQKKIEKLKMNMPPPPPHVGASSRTHLRFVDANEENNGANNAKDNQNTPVAKIGDLHVLQINKKSTPRRSKKAKAEELSKEAEEMAARLEREENLARVEHELDVRRALLGKGRRNKVGVDKYGVPVFRWKPDRKR